MENSVSFFLGLTYVVLAFFLCFSVCLSVKVFYRAFIKTENPQEKIKPEKKKIKRERQKVNKIIINPDEINKIYVKKD